MNILKKYEFILKNLDCANCANKIQNKLAENPNYKNVIVNFNTLKLSLESDLKNIKLNITKIVKELEPEVEVLDLHEKEEAQNRQLSKKISSDFIRIIVGVIFMIFGVCIKLPCKLNLISIIISYVILLFRTGKKTIKLLKKKVIDENFLVTVSCIGAFFIGKQFEGLMVIILYEIGKLLEDKAVNNTRKSIANLMDIKPEYANLKHENHEHKVNPNEVNVGDIIVVKQGEKVPLDGIIVKGKASLDIASLTGESKLRDVKENDSILSGSINAKGLLEIKVTKKYEDSTVSQILELLENATDKKAKTETFVNRTSRIYTPIVVGLALLVAILLPILANITYSESIYRALIFLVVSCPCAIVISVPLSYFTGIGKASKVGILIKGSNYLDSLKDIKQIVFDKTGTLTRGEFSVEKINVYDKDYSEIQILEYAAIGESFSNHPIGSAILKEYHRKVSQDLNKKQVKDFEEISGKGVQYKFENRTVKIGNAEFTKSKKENTLGTVIYVNIAGKVIGSLILNDTIKGETKLTLEKLRRLGIITKMFTGDNYDIALKVGKEIGINEVKAEMLPQDKYSELEKMIENNKIKNTKIAFVGDGINDSPVLALSDIGISMGGIGASSAIEASDVVIMTDNLAKIEEAIKISKTTNKIIKQNLIFALIIKVLILILSIFGIATMWQAVFADVGVTLITIINTMRILKNN